MKKLSKFVFVLIMIFSSIYLQSSESVESDRSEEGNDFFARVFPGLDGDNHVVCTFKLESMKDYFITIYPYGNKHKHAKLNILMPRAELFEYSNNKKDHYYNKDYESVFDNQEDSFSWLITKKDKKKKKKGKKIFEISLQGSEGDDKAKGKAWLSKKFANDKNINNDDAKISCEWEYID